MSRINRFDSRKQPPRKEHIDPPAVRYEIFRKATNPSDQRYGRTTVVDYIVALRTAQAIASALNTVVDVDEVTPFSALPYASFQQGGVMSWVASPEDAEAAGFTQTEKGWELDANTKTD